MAKTIGGKIRELRREKGISQDALARLLGVTFQAVSKWETNMTAPDVGLIPSIASFFGVSIDELFDYNVLENEQKIDGICRAAAACRSDRPDRAEALLREGLKQYPANETILTMLMYVLCAIPDRDRDLAETCRQLIGCAADEGVRCDALRILAETCRRTGELDQMEAALEQIPEFYFTRLECVARLTGGTRSLEAARFQMNRSGGSMIEMLGIMADRYAEAGNGDAAGQCRRISEGILAVLRREEGRSLEVSGYEWIPD